MTSTAYPLISIIVPVYNAADTITSCIESLEGQTYTNLEIILVNDKSTDNSDEVISSLASKYENIHILSASDNNVSIARNMGLDFMQGEFFTFVDADDRIRTDMLEKLYNIMVETDSDMVGCGFETVNAGSGPCVNEITTSPSENALVTYTSVEYLNEEILKKNNSRCWSKLYRSSALKEVRFDSDIVIGEDLNFVLSAICKSSQITETDYPGYLYTINPQGAMLRPFTPRYMHQITCWEKARNIAVAMDPSSEDSLTQKLLISLMLVAGKLAELDRTERNEASEYIKTVRNKLKEEMKKEEAFKLLPFGYKFKCRLFNACPSLYLWLYHFHKYL